jgi:hypothetical protein
MITIIDGTVPDLGAAAVRETMRTDVRPLAGSVPEEAGQVSAQEKCPGRRNVNSSHQTRANPRTGPILPAAPTPSWIDPGREPRTGLSMAHAS